MRSDLIAPGQLADALWFAASDPVPDGPLLIDLSVPLGGQDELVSRTLRAARTSAYVIIGVAPSEVPAGNVPLAAALTLSLVTQDDPVAAGVGESARPFVAVADPVADAHAIAETVRARPLASSSLAALLQQTARLPVWEGLIAESASYSTLLAGPEFRAWLAGATPPLPPPDDDEPVLVERAGDVLTLTLNRPARRNAYGHGVRDALVAALLVARIDEAVKVELRGVGPSFCSGGDLAEFGTAPDPATAHLIRLRHGAGLLLHEIAARTSAHLHGACIGAGIELPAFSGRVVAAADTRIGLPELSMGLVPGAGGTVSITLRIGRWRTAWLALTGRHIDAALALRWGLVDELEAA